MVWGCFWAVGRCDLYIFDRDFESKKHGYSANSYTEVLDAELVGHWTEGLIFMQDNASIHIAHKVRDWFREQGIPCTDWPPYSPDLNPIEEFFAELKMFIKRNWQCYTDDFEQDFKAFLEWCVNTIGTKKSSAEKHFRHSGLSIKKL